ncbi:MAG: lipoate--protein ligase family protein [Spirochaetales bacterium]
MTKWRFLRSGSASGAWNMAVDHTLLESMSRQFQPFFRLYTWEPACLSLGRFQNTSTGLLPGVLDRFPVVRRSTGGGAIWHDRELTYSLGFRAEDLDTSGVKATYERLCGFLLATWKELGYEAGFAKDLGPAPSLGAVTPACFAGTEAYDILVDGRKLGGNAQRRERGFVFQHGSIPFRLDWSALGTLFAPEFLPVPEKVTDLDSLGYREATDALGDRLASNLELCLGILLEPSNLGPAETERADQWAYARYSNIDWTSKGTGTLRPVELPVP